LERLERGRLFRKESAGGGKKKIRHTRPSGRLRLRVCWELLHYGSHIEKKSESLACSERKEGNLQLRRGGEGRS